MRNCNKNQGKPQSHVLFSRIQKKSEQRSATEAIRKTRMMDNAILKCIIIYALLSGKLTGYM